MVVISNHEVVYGIAHRGNMTTVVNHLIYDAFGKVTAESHPAIAQIMAEENVGNTAGKR